MTNKKMRLSLVWLHANIKQELWKVTEEVCLKFLALQQKQLVWYASLLQFSCINPTILLFFFPLLLSVSWCLSTTKKIFHSTLNLKKFPLIFTTTALNSLLMRAISLLASSSHRNFGTGSLNHKNKQAHCFSIIAWVLSNSVINLFCCWNHFVTIFFKLNGPR